MVYSFGLAACAWTGPGWSVWPCGSSSRESIPAPYLIDAHLRPKVIGRHSLCWSGPLPILGGQAKGGCGADRLTPIADGQLAQNGRYVVVDCLGRHDKTIGDFRVGEMLAKQTQDLEFTGCEPCGVGLRGRPGATWQRSDPDLTQTSGHLRSAGPRPELLKDLKRPAEVVFVGAVTQRVGLLVWASTLVPDRRCFGMLSGQMENERLIGRGHRGGHFEPPTPQGSRTSKPGIHWPERSLEGCREFGGGPFKVVGQPSSLHADQPDNGLGPESECLGQRSLPRAVQADRGRHGGFGPVQLSPKPRTGRDETG